MATKPAPKPPSALSNLLGSFTRRGRDLFDRYAPRGLRGKAKTLPRTSLEECDTLATALLSVRGEASGVAIAKDLLTLYATLSSDEKLAFFGVLADRFDPDPAALNKAWATYQRDGRAGLPALARAVESPRLELFRRLNMAPGGTAGLVRMRSDLLGHLKTAGGALDALDADLSHLLGSWFNRGFLTMQEIGWESPARLLESVIRYEAVHLIRGWDDLRRRLNPQDRRCFAFFHPAMPDEPLIFVEVGLTSGIPGSIQDILADERAPIAAEQADTAVFYSISNCQHGLTGISFGHFLIKQVAIDLQHELPNLTNFVTLSPVPGFMAWLRNEAEPIPAWLGEDDWWTKASDDQRNWLTRQAIVYFGAAKNARGRPLDPVARFHLGNGARLERLNWLGDTSANGLRQSAGLMVNYLYDLPLIEENHEAYVERGEVIAGAPFHTAMRELGVKLPKTGA